MRSCRDRAVAVLTENLSSDFRTHILNGSQLHVTLVSGDLTASLDSVDTCSQVHTPHSQTHTHTIYSKHF